MWKSSRGMNISTTHCVPCRSRNRTSTNTFANLLTVKQGLSILNMLIMHSVRAHLR